MDDSLRELIAGLVSDKVDVEGEALDRCYSLIEDEKLGVEHALELIDTAAAPITGAGVQDDAAGSLLCMSRDIIRSLDGDLRVVLEHVREVMPRIDAELRSHMLDILCAIPTMSSARLYVKYVEEYGDAMGELDIPEFDIREFDEEGNEIEPTEEDMRIAVFLLPFQFERATTNYEKSQLYRSLASYFEARLIQPDDLAGRERDFLAVLASEAMVLRKRQRPASDGVGWKYKEPYIDHRELVGAMFDAGGWWRSVSVLDAIESLDDLTDPWLRMMRATSLIRAGREISSSELKRIAESPPDRFWLRLRLDEMEWEDTLPEACRDQKKLAEGCMMDWLSFPTELRQEPDEIELMHIETRVEESEGSPEGVTLDYYFFRFRVLDGKHFAKKDGWMVGMAGGYERVAGGTPKSTGDTFSHFTKWKKKTLNEHVASFLDLDED